MQKEIYLKCKDYTVSGEQFQLLYDKEQDMLITHPAPATSDLGKYYESEEYISHTDSKQSFFDKIYQLVKAYTISKKVKMIRGFCDPKESEISILDVGCGTGDFMVACKKSGFQVCGIEPSKKAKEIVTSKIKADLFDDLSDLNSQKFDVITMWHVLEHIPNLKDYISKLKSLLKPNGTLIIAVPNFKSYDANYYKEFWAAYDVPRHLSHFSKKTISKLFLKEKMEVVKILPMKFDSYYVSLLSEKYKTGSSNFLKAIYIGFISNLKAIQSKEHSSLIYIIKKSN